MSEISDMVVPKPGSTSNYDVTTGGSVARTTNSAVDHLQCSEAKSDLLPCKACKRKYISEEYRIPPGAPAAGRRDYPANYVGLETLRPRYYAQCKICREQNTTRMRKIREARRALTSSALCKKRFADGVPNDVAPTGAPTEAPINPIDPGITLTVPEGGYGSGDSLNLPEIPRHVSPQLFLSPIFAHQSDASVRLTVPPAAQFRTDIESQAALQAQEKPLQVPELPALIPKIVNTINTGNVKTGSTSLRNANFVLEGPENNPPAKHMILKGNTARAEVVPKKNHQREKGQKRQPQPRSTQKRALSDNQTEDVAIPVKYRKTSDGKKGRPRNPKALQIKQYVPPDFFAKAGNPGSQQQKGLQPSAIPYWPQQSIPLNACTYGVPYNTTSAYYAPQLSTIEQAHKAIKDGRAALDMYRKLAVQLGEKHLLVRDLDLDNMIPVGGTNKYKTDKSGNNSSCSSSYGPAFEGASYSSDASENRPVEHNNQHERYKSGMNSSNSYGPVFGEASYSQKVSTQWPTNQHEGYMAAMNSDNTYGPAFEEASYSSDASKQLSFEYNKHHDGYKSGIGSGNSYTPAIEEASYPSDASKNWTVEHNNQVKGYMGACHAINPPIEEGNFVPDVLDAPVNGEFHFSEDSGLGDGWLTPSLPLPVKEPDDVPIDPALLDMGTRRPGIPELSFTEMLMGDFL